MMKSNRGVALATLVVEVLIMLTITGTITYTSLDTMKLRKLDDMYSDIRLLKQKVTDYHIENDSIPVLENVKINATNLQGIINNTGGNKNNQNDSDIYYIIDLEKFGRNNIKIW